MSKKLKRSSWSLSLVKNKLEFQVPAQGRRGKEEIASHLMQRNMPSWEVVVMPRMVFREVSFSSAALPVHVT